MKTLVKINPPKNFFLPLVGCISNSQKEIVILDPTVPDSNHIASGIKRGFATYILESQPDAIEQITTVLAQHTGIEALHIITHGSAGSLYLGTKELNSNNIENYSQQLQQWRNSFSANASIILYGCSVAAGDRGHQFLTQLHQLTGANIAASNNKTGNQALGGDWELLVKIGHISTPLALTNAAMASYQGILGVNLFKDINPGAPSSLPQNFINFNNTLYFQATDATNATELWKSDGTLAGTVLFKDINPGTNNSSPSNFFNLNNTLYFTATDATNGNELWKSDGTSAGTVLVKDIRPGSIGSSPSNLINFNNTLYFQATDPTNGYELWKSDGTLAGTVLFEDINLGTNIPGPSDLINVNNTLYFQANDATNGMELWKSDGTLAGTVLVKDINPGSIGSNLSNFFNFNNTLYFSAIDPTNAGELWKSDGTLAGTVLVKDISPGATSSAPSDFFNFNNTLYFYAADSTNGYELWKSDGTSAGTVLVKDINPGAPSSFPRDFFNFNNTLYFYATDATNGTELWKSDGTSAGTVLVKDINPGTNHSFPRDFFNFNNTLYFRATDATNGTELWKSDGTSAGTVLVKDINPGPSSSSATNFFNFNNTIYFRATDATNGSELWSLAPATITNVTASNADGTYGIDATINITATFSEAVTITGTPQLQLATDTTNQLANYTGGSGSTTLTFNYRVQPGDTTLDLQYLTTTALVLNGGTIKDSVNIDANLNLPALASLQSLGGSKAIVIDGVAPTITSVTSTTTDGSYNTTGNINVTINFSEAVTLAGGNMTVALDTGGTVTITPFTGTSAVGSYTPVAGQNSTDLNSTGITLAVGATLRDAAGNNATLTIPAGQSLANSKAIVVDTVVPTVALTSASPTTTNAPFLVTATFSESVTGFIASDVNLTNSTISNFTGSGTTYNFTVTPNASGAVTVDVPEAIATDTAGNNNTAATQLTRTADITAPTVALTSASPTTTNAPFLVTATFSESVTGFIASDVNLTNSTISGFTGSGTTYNFTVTPNASGAVTVDVPAATATDIAGNNNTAATQLTRTADITAPTVALTSASPTTTNAPFLVTATFSESVIGFIASDVNLTNSTISNFTGSGTTYNFTVTPNADGPVTVDVPAATATDIVGNNNTAATQLTRTNDATAPTVALTSASPTTTNAPFLVTATFSEIVTGFSATGVNVTNGNVSNFAGSGSNYTFTVTPNADGNVTVDVPAAIATDTAGNNNTAATQLTRTNDATAPTVALTSTSTPTVTGLFSVTAIFSEDVTGFDNTDISVANATIGNVVTVDAKTYTFDVTPTADGNVTVDVPEAIATDRAGNNNTAATQLTRTADITAPTVALTSAAPTTTNAPFLVTATFSESVTEFSATGVNVTNSTISNFTGSGTTYNFTVTPNADGAVTVDVPAATATDIAGNNNTAATQLTRTNDATAPTVALTSTSTTTVTAPFSVTATFSENVTGFDNTDITVANATIGNVVTVDAKTYTFDVTPTADGNVTVDVPAATATDTAGNNNTAATQLTRTADITAPTVALTSTSATNTNAPFLVTATFSESVTGFSATGVNVTNGNVSNFAGSGSNYTFTVTPNADGNVTVDVPEAIATDTAGNNNTAATQLTRTNDATAPNVTLTSTSTPTVTGLFSVTATFNEDVTSFDNTDISVANATVNNFVKVDGKTYTFDVTPAASGNVTVDVLAAIATDTAGNNNTAATQLTRTANITTPDITPPNVTLTSTSTSTVTGLFSVTATFNEDVTGFDNTDITVANATVNNFVKVDAKTYTFDVTPAASGNVTVDVLAAIATDTAGNNNTAATQLTRTANITTPDITPPTVALTSNSTPTVTGLFSVTATFNEDVTDFDNTDITVANATVDNFVKVDAKTYTFDVTPAASGNVTVDISAATATDTAGNNNTAATQLTRTANITTPDITPPNVTLTSTSTPTVTGLFSVTATFNEDVTGFDNTDITVANATVNNFVKVDAKTYTFDVTPAASGNVTVDVLAATATDTAGNNNTAATQLTRTANVTTPDITPPNVTLTSTSTPTVTGLFSVTASFNEDVTSFDNTDITVANATVNNFVKVDAKTYIFDVTPTANGNVTVDVLAAIATDTAGNNNTAATQLTRTADVTTPDITPPNVTLTSNSTPTVTDLFSVTATFNEDVTSFDNTDKLSNI